MDKKWKRIGILALSLTLVIAALGVPSVSAEDAGQYAKLVVDYEPVEEMRPTGTEGNGYRLYYIAAISEGEGGTASYVYNGSYGGSGLSLEGLDPYSVEVYDQVRAMLIEYSRYINGQALQPDFTAQILSGAATFEGLPEGLYLASGPQYRQGDYTYTPAAFMISIPYIAPGAGTKSNHITARVKFSSSNAADTIEEPRPDPRPDPDPETDLDPEPDPNPDPDPDTHDEPTEEIIDFPEDIQIIDDEVPLADLPDLPEGPNTPEDSNTPEHPNTPADDILIPDIEILDDGVPLGDWDPETPGGDTVDIPDEPTPKSAPLPQTGLLWWPVPLLAVSGLLMMIVGGKLRRQ